jgi:very-short-patch-repair endonuclease
MASQPIDDSAGESQSLFRSNLPLEIKLERARTELLDLSARNRLLNIPRSARNARTLEIIDERSKEIFKLLVRDQRPLTFLPGRAAAGIPEHTAENEIAELAQPDDDGVDDRGVANRHIDTKLQTRLTPVGLQKRLMDLYFDARTLEEEQGVNILFLALGTLKWIDPTNAANVRFAPLILVPVALERGNAAEKFKLYWRQEDPAPNLSLEAYLDRVHGLKLPRFDADEEFDPSAYMAAVADAVSAKADWTVNQDDVVLGFFSFAKFLMYRDLDPSNWPADARLSEHALIRPLLSDGFDGSESLLAEDAPVDAHVPPAEMVHIVDSDSSQTLAVHEVRRGRNLVIQGPPGTGKSQTIANIIASAVAEGKTVLFVAEKMAALEVVKRRLDSTGVGAACLELHSNKANKRVVLEELRRTWELGEPKGREGTASLNARLTEARDQLNAHAIRMHQPLGAAGFTPYQVIGHLIRLRQNGQAPTDIKLIDADAWSTDGLRDRTSLLEELLDRINDIGVPAGHIWRGIDLPVVLPPDEQRITARILHISGELDRMRAEQAAIAKVLEVSPPDTIRGLDALAALAIRVVGAPNLTPDALGAPEWDTEAQAINALLAAGRRHAELVTALSSTFNDLAWTTDVTVARATLAPLPGTMSLEAFTHIDELTDRIPRLQEDVRRLAAALGRDTVPATVRTIAELARIGERVSAAPDADPAAFASDLWDSGVERAGDLALAVDVLEKARSEIGSALSEAAWSTDLRNARRVLGEHGTGFLRILSGEWRAANRQVRSVLASPKTALDEQLTLLDALARGQAALETIRAEATFGHTAFGAEWRGERSVAAPLLALIDWMRTLRGLGSAPRVIAGRHPDRNSIGKLSSQVSELAEVVRMISETLWADLHPCRGLAFGDADSADRVALDALRDNLAELREAHHLYQDISRDGQPLLDQRRKALDELAEAQAAATAIAAGSKLGSAAFASAWQGTNSEWPLLHSAAHWLNNNLDIHQLSSRIDDRVELARRAAVATDERTGFLAQLTALLADLRADSSAAIESTRAIDLPLPDLAERLEQWGNAGELLSKWVAYRSRAKKAIDLGMGELVNRLHNGDLATDRAFGHFEMSYFEAVFTAQVAGTPAIADFDGDLHSRTVKSFTDLDRQRIRQSAFDVVRAHHRQIPPATGGALGPLGVLKGEIARKRGHMPIRQLMHKAGPAVQAIKPVFMMSPLSVAQFLQPGASTFDLLVMDEASQIQPVDALGAIARCRQVVVVGDPKQLPPTSFFAKMTGSTDGDDEQDGGAQVADIESILGLFTARGLPTRMLRWHYRSRHESLIAVSNRQFYENKLFIVPSPHVGTSGMGLHFHYVQNGVFESGTTRTNPNEAKTVAEAIIAHARTHPELSLGVVAFSVAQRRAIQDQLELQRRHLSPEQEAFFQDHPSEPFFIKNLENVQGDERDVIFISVGYGPTAPGQRPPMRFGPVGQDGGERRLNVLISRAKRRCDVFSSMTDEDIDAEFASTRKGVFALKLFMHYARTGRMTTAETKGRDHDSVFEAQVAEALQERGYHVHRQVGIAGFFIDLAITDPERADRFLLGIECDGEAYHSARSARDRDRLRQAVLEDHGWIIHRIWSTDWFRRPQQQLDRVIASIEAAKIELHARDEQAARNERPVLAEIASIERAEVAEVGGMANDGPGAAPVAYAEAVLTRPPHLVCELHEAPTGTLTALAEQVVAVEGPVHVEEIINRIRDAWGVRRAGSRIQEAVERAVEVAVRQGRLHKEGSFLSIPGANPVVRDRSAAQSATLRRPEALPPSELKVALVDVVARNFGATEEQLVLAVSRAVGFKSTSSQLRGVILEGLGSAIDEALIVMQDDLAVLGPAAAVRNSTTLIKPTPVEQLIAEGESERLEFKQTLQWDVNLRRPNKNLEEVAVKTIAGFANRDGGTLLVGVHDDGTVAGLQEDYACLGGNKDKMELHLTNILNKHFSQTFRAVRVTVTFPAVGAQSVCRIDVQRSRTPVYVTIRDRNGNMAERFFVRSGNSTQELPPSQIASYVKEHFE